MKVVIWFVSNVEHVKGVTCIVKMIEHKFMVQVPANKQIRQISQRSLKEFQKT